jgi:type I restriction-modification system DNA methylase subunit
MSNVSGVIKSIQDLMRKDVGVDGDAQRISQLVWMFFLKTPCYCWSPTNNLLLLFGVITAPH